MTPCQEFIGAKSASGYGQVRFSQGGPLVYAHRLAYALHYGTDPTGKVVMHTCDNPACCNPEHLVLGTQKENMADMWFKGRARPGRAGCRPKFSNDVIAQVRSMHAAGRTQTSIAKATGMSQSYVSDLVREKWRRS